MPFLTKSSKVINVCVSTLEAELDFAVKPSINGKRLLDYVAKTIGLREVWFFGLLYRTNEGEEIWLNLNKKLSSFASKKSQPLTFEFRVKYYPEDISEELIQEITQRLFYLQVKEAILKDRLLCPPEAAVLLASYACQAKYGDYDAARFARSVRIDQILSPKTLVECDLRSEEWMTLVMRWYAEHQGMYPQTAMLQYLQIAEGLRTYGVDFFEIFNRRGTPLLLGIDAFGLAVYKPPDKLYPKVGFPWSEIRNIAFTDRKFTIKPIDKKSPDLVFMTESVRVNKKILDLCIGNNELYSRRRKPMPIEVQQLRSQAQQESAFRDQERERLASERAARLEAEQRVRELEARLEAVESRLRNASAVTSPCLDTDSRITSLPTDEGVAPNDQNSPLTQADSPISETAGDSRIPLPLPPSPTPPPAEELKEGSDSSSASRPPPPMTTTMTTNRPVFTTSTSSHTATPCETPPSKSSRANSLSPTTNSKTPPGIGQTPLSRHPLVPMSESEEAVHLLETTLEDSQSRRSGMAGGNVRSSGEGEEERIPSPTNREVEFPRALVENLRSEELRHSVMSRDPKERARLQTVYRELHKPPPDHTRSLNRPRTHTCLQAAENDQQALPGYDDKYDTIRKIRRGNTKQRVDSFEAL